VTNESNTAEDPHERGRATIVSAFEAARARGKEDWYEMSVAVLKNRMLDVTNREFDESEFDAESFSEFLRLFPELIDVDTAQRPPRVRLKGVEASSGGTHRSKNSNPRTGRWTIRADLWNAIVDYESQSAYYWENGQAHAVAAASDAEGPILPTITPAVSALWRDEFVGGLPSPVQSAFEADLTRWRDVSHATGALPPQLRGQWTTHLKSCILDRLNQWFGEQGLDAPTDLVAHGPSTDRPPLESSVEELRDLVMRYIQTMSKRELLSLSIPLSAIVRVDARHE
jgi:hypothetical protein